MQIFETMLLLVVGFIFGTVVTLVTQGAGLYKQGQIDAINGNIKFEVVEHPDKTRTWEVIKKSSDAVDNCK